MNKKGYKLKIICNHVFLFILIISGCIAIKNLVYSYMINDKVVKIAEDKSDSVSLSIISSKENIIIVEKKREIEGGKLIVTTFQITHDRGPIRFKDGRRIEALDLGVGKDGRNTYICKEGKRFIIDKSEFDTVMKDGIDVLSQNKIILTKEQLNIIRENTDKLSVNNISESKIEELEGNEFEKDLEPIYIKFAKMHDIKVKELIDRD